MPAVAEPKFLMGQSFRNPQERSPQERSSQARDRVRQRLWIEAIQSTLEIDISSDSLQRLDISEIKEEKESFSFSVEQPLYRSRRAELSWSLGFGYRSESLSSSPPSSSRPPSSGNPPRSTSSPRPSSSSSPERTPRNPPPSSPPPTRNSPSGNPPQSGGSESGRPASGSSSQSSSTTPRPTNSRNESNPSNEPPAPTVAADTTTAQPIDSAAEMRTGVVEFAQRYRRRDRTGHWLARSQFNLGTELATSPETMGADAQFFSWVGQVERSQSLGNDHQLTLSLDTQLSPNNLLPMHQFKTKDRRFEGFDRDARPSEISGNNGIRISLENHFVLLRNNRQAPLFSLVPFADAGYTWGQSDPRRDNQQFLGRTGFAVLLEPLPGLDIQYDYLTQWGDLEADAETQNHYITLGYQTRW
ncbi:MAG: hypothetical protein AAF703_20815 [Cyanobacteria bacterium P01_D01_bin.105]